MKEFDPLLTGWGIDFWYHHVLGEHSQKIAIIDAIPCINPHDSTKGGHREIVRLEKTSTSYKIFIKIMEQYNIKFEGNRFQFKQFGRIKKSS
jgi:hypothetical protein